MINVDQHDCDDKVRRCSSFSALPQPCLHWSESDGYSDSDHIQIHHNQTAGRIYQIRTTDFNLANKCLSSHHFVPNKQTTLAASMPARTRSLPYIYPFSCQSNSIPTYMELTHSWLAFQITPLSVSEVIWDQTTSNFLVYNLQLPHNFQLPHGRHYHDPCEGVTSYKAPKYELVIERISEKGRRFHRTPVYVNVTLFFPSRYIKMKITISKKEGMEVEKYL